MKSELLGNEREILTYTPPGYDSKRAESYPTVYLFDGNDPDGEVFASQTIENLIHERKIPPVIVIRIANPPGRRMDDLACNERFSQFLAKELVPFVRSNYHVSSLASRTVIGGKSMGGLAAACAGMHQPQVFGLLLIQSGSFWWQLLQKDCVPSVGKLASDHGSDSYISRRNSMYTDVGRRSVDRGGIESFEYD
ncbi:MAG: esterase family protein [Blastocatellia bacterium]|nr:esterase family protein [Blastocatellia bacterium]